MRIAGSSYTPPARIWSSSLQKDIQSVAEEASLPPAAAAAIVAAARAGVVSCNPGVLLHQVLGLRPLFELMGRRPMLHLIRMMPSTLNHDPDTLAINFKSLAPVFGDRKFITMLLK